MVTLCLHFHWLKINSNLSDKCLPSNTTETLTTQLLKSCPKIVDLKSMIKGTNVNLQPSSHLYEVLSAASQFEATAALPTGEQCQMTYVLGDPFSVLNVVSRHSDLSGNMA